jgi:hypothetical protein
MSLSEGTGFCMRFKRNWPNFREQVDKVPESRMNFIPVSTQFTKQDRHNFIENLDTNDPAC